MSEGASQRHPGLAAERTELAWGRSTLALFACGAAIAKGLPRVTGAEGRPLVGAALFVLGALVWLSGVPYARARNRTEHGHRRPSTGRGIATLALGTAAVGLAAFVIVVFFPS